MALVENGCFLLFLIIHEENRDCFVIKLLTAKKKYTLEDLLFWEFHCIIKNSKGKKES